jgi:hypothetical protein
MAISSDLLAADLGRIFGDWAEEVTYRQVASTFDAQTQTRSETLTDTTVQAVVRTVTARQVRQSAGMLHAGDVQFLVRDAELPERPPRRTSRVVHGSDVYQIVGYQRSVDGLAWQIEGRRV